MNMIVQSTAHRSVTNSEDARTSRWCVVWVESNTAVSNWFRMCWCERWDFTSNTEHVIENRRLLFSHMKVMWWLCSDEKYKDKECDFLQILTYLEKTESPLSPQVSLTTICDLYLPLRFSDRRVYFPLPWWSLFHFFSISGQTIWTTIKSPSVGR